MRGFVDRFSIDLDFDLITDYKKIEKIRKNFESIFDELELEIKDQSANVPQYFLKYSAERSTRNTIKVDVIFPPPKANTYELVTLSDIDRVMRCETVDTLFANKMVAVIDRFERSGGLAGRDIFDIHTYFLKGFDYNKEVIIERRQKDIKKFFEELIEFIKTHVTERVIDQDLNHLLPIETFQKIRKNLKAEVLVMLQDELKRLS